MIIEIKCYLTEKGKYFGNFAARKFRKFTEIFLTVHFIRYCDQHIKPLLMMIYKYIYICIRDHL